MSINSVRTLNQPDAAQQLSLTPEARLTSWYDGEQSRLLRVARKVVHDPQIAAEVVQSAFIRALSRITTFRGESRLSTWLTRITFRLALNERRRQRRYENRVVPIDEVSRVAQAADQRDPILIARVRAAVDALPESLRVPLILTEIEGYTHAEVAARLGITAGASRTRASRARDILRVELADLSSEGNENE